MSTFEAFEAVAQLLVKHKLRESETPRVLNGLRKSRNPNRNISQLMKRRNV